MTYRWKTGSWMDAPFLHSLREIISSGTSKEQQMEVADVQSIFVEEMEPDEIGCHRIFT